VVLAGPRQRLTDALVIIVRTQRPYGGPAYTSASRIQTLSAHSPATMDSFYKYHVFFCLNQREPGATRPSCANCNAQAMQEYAKKRVKQLGLAGPGQVRINKAGCLERCEEGPTIVVYPEGTWYTYVDEADIDEIVDSHLANGKVVERLKI
jgi:(2Fe-2S) ferredoxin